MRYPTEKKRALVFTDEEKKTLIGAGFISNQFTNWKSGRSLPGKYVAMEISALLGKPLIEILYGNAPLPAQKLKAGRPRKSAAA